MSSVSFLRLGRAILISFLVAILSLLPLALVAYRADRPMEAISSCVLAATLVGAWTSGFLGAKGQITPSKWLGLLCGIGYFLLIFLGSFFFSGTQITWSQRLFLLGVSLLCILIGAIVGGRTTGQKGTRSRIRRAKRRMR